MKKQLGLIGLGVMGASLARNFARNGIKMALYNRFVAGTEETIAEKAIAKYPELAEASGFEDLEAFVDDLESPRKIFLMVPAGTATDMIIEALIPMLSSEDLIIDGGNAHYKQTEQRCQLLSNHGIHFLGTGVSGGEAGALNGPSIMPGGSKTAYAMAKPHLGAIAALDKNGNACCGYIGKGGAGHFVKMVHNGIEYAEMQFIAELYGVMRHSWGYSSEQIADIFESWLSTTVTGYLLEIAVDILRKKEEDKPMVDLILDKAGNKGTGSWTTIAACELGVPVPTLSAALFARYQSSFKQIRTEASKHYSQHIARTEINEQQLLKAYQTARIINHHQGFDLINMASETYDWGISLSEVSRIWTDGCILRSALVQEAAQLFLETANLLLHPEIIKRVADGLPALREVVGNTSLTGASIPCLSSALSYFEIFSRDQSTANIIQALRDYFGAHRFQRKDDPDGPFHHINWTS